jgi:hypothetical protein
VPTIRPHPPARTNGWPREAPGGRRRRARGLRCRSRCTPSAQAPPTHPVPPVLLPRRASSLHRAPCQASRCRCALQSVHNPASFLLWRAPLKHGDHANGELFRVFCEETRNNSQFGEGRARPGTRERRGTTKHTTNDHERTKSDQGQTSSGPRSGHTRASSDQGRTSSEPRADDERTKGGPRAGHERTKGGPRAGHERATLGPRASHEHDTSNPPRTVSYSGFLRGNPEQLTVRRRSGARTAAGEKVAQGPSRGEARKHGEEATPRSAASGTPRLNRRRPAASRPARRCRSAAASRPRVAPRGRRWRTTHADPARCCCR